MLNPPQQFSCREGGPEPPIFYTYDNTSTHQPNTHTPHAHTHCRHTHHTHAHTCHTHTPHTAHTHTHTTHTHTPHTHTRALYLHHWGEGWEKEEEVGVELTVVFTFCTWCVTFFVIRYSPQTSIRNDSDALFPNGNSNRGLISISLVSL